MEDADTVTQLSGYDGARQLVLEELDLEIRLGQKLQQTVESRIAWATYLQSSLSAVSESQGPGSTPNIIQFQLAAQDALKATEAPLLPILSREARFPTCPTLDVTPTLPATPFTNPYTRPNTRHTRLQRSPSTIHPPRFLYLRDSSTNTIARLICPDCQRGDFPRVQSLLNHCRIQHSREFGSHDECIRGCAVQVPVEEEAWVIENGSELRNFSLPSLRRLFELAVGNIGGPLEITPANDTAMAQRSGGQEENHVPEQEVQQASAPLPAAASTHLSRTLGHHAETPDLAPFLGRASNRRGIPAHAENIPVDIESGRGVSVRRRWQKPLFHRSRARPALDVAIPVEEPAGRFTPNASSVTQGSRFHVVARVTISDRSLWIPIERRLSGAPDHTHRWWLSIQAPTYSLPLGSILERATVTYLSPGRSPALTLHLPFEASGPSFFASGTSATPFLARLRLEWTSGSLNPPLEVDHWVELDMPHAGTAVLGDEQVLDIELDRNTVFRPVANYTQCLEPWCLSNESPRTQVEPEPVFPAYVDILRSLVPKFPLTLREAKAKVTTQLPYKLVSSRAHFNALVPGRQKAIEWARARVLRDAYEEFRVEQTPGVADYEYPRLSTGDIFSWLADTRFSHHAMQQSTSTNIPPRRRPSKQISPSVEDTFCAACGLDLTQHPTELGFREGPSSTCPFSPVSRLPLLDIDSHASGKSQYPSENFVPGQKWVFHRAIREVLAATDPALTLAIHGIIVSLNLSCFPASNTTSISSDSTLLCTAIPPSLDDPDIPRLDIPSSTEPEYTSLASSAILAIAVRAFAHRLVGPAATAFARDHAPQRGRHALVPTDVCRSMVGPFLARDGIFSDLPPSPVALALSTLVQRVPRDLSAPSAAMETS